MPTKKQFLLWAGYSSNHIIEICECTYDEFGNIIDFATDSWDEDNLKNIPINKVLHLNIMNRNYDKQEDIPFMINSNYQIVSTN